MIIKFLSVPIIKSLLHLITKLINAFEFRGMESKHFSGYIRMYYSLYGFTWEVFKDASRYLRKKGFTEKDYKWETDMLGRYITNNRRAIVSAYYYKRYILFRALGRYIKTFFMNYEKELEIPYNAIRTYSRLGDMPPIQREENDENESNDNSDDLLLLIDEEETEH